VDWAVTEALTKQINEKKKELGIVDGDPAKRLKSTLEAMETRVKNRIADLRFEIAKGERMVKSKTAAPTSPKLEEMRKELATVQAEHDAVFGKRQMTDEQRLKSALSAAKRAEESANAELANARKGIFTKPAQKGVTRSAELDAIRARTTAAREEVKLLKKMSEPQRTDEEIAIQTAKTRLARSNADYAERIAKGNFAKKPRKELDISKDPEAVRLKAENERLKREFEKARFEDEQKKRHAVQKVADVVKNVVLAAPRTLKTAFDVSAPFRQGAVISLGDMIFNPIRFGRQMGRMFGSLKSEKYFQEREAALRLRPNADLYESSKLDFSHLDGKLTAKEENMRSDFAEMVPGVRMSNRAYTEFLNEQRADTMDAWVDMLGGKDRITQDQANFLAHAINDFTGRSKIEVRGAEGVLNWLAKYFFSPRYFLSRLKVLTGVPVLRGILTGPKVGFKTRALVAATYGKALVGLAAFYTMAKLYFGDDSKISKDARSSDFGKVRIGKTRIDPMAGLQQIAVLLTRGVGGKVKELDNDVVPVSYDVLGRFARNKLAPFPAAVVDRTFGGGKNAVGEKVTLGGQALDMVTPLSLNDAIKTFKTQGPARGTVIQMLNVLGMGTQNF